MESSLSSRTLIIGIGNTYRSDDAVGLDVAGRLKDQVHGNAVIAEHGGDGASLMESWKVSDKVFLIDAVSSGANPGTVFRFEAHTERVPSQFFHYSTHQFSVAEAIELARVLGQLPAWLVVYGIEGENFGAGTQLSPSVEIAACEVTNRLMRELMLI